MKYQVTRTTARSTETKAFERFIDLSVWFDSVKYKAGSATLSAHGAQIASVERVRDLEGPLNLLFRNEREAAEKAALERHAVRERKAADEYRNKVPEITARIADLEQKVQALQLAMEQKHGFARDCFASEKVRPLNDKIDDLRWLLAAIAKYPAQ